MPAFAVVVGPQDKQDILDRDDQRQSPENHGHDAKDVCPQQGTIRGRSVQSFAEGVDWTGADVAVDNPESAQNKNRVRFFVECIAMGLSCFAAIICRELAHKLLLNSFSMAGSIRRVQVVGNFRLNTRASTRPVSIQTLKRAFACTANSIPNQLSFRYRASAKPRSFRSTFGKNTSNFRATVSGIADCHSPFPGVGHVVKEGRDFRWLPTGLDNLMDRHRTTVERCTLTFFASIIRLTVRCRPSKTDGVPEKRV